jgi:MFS family permease
MARVRIINANFTRLFYGSAISFVGDYVFDTTLILWISTRLLPGKDYAPAAVSGVLVAVAAAIIVVGPVAGVFVDRWDKRRTMMVSDLVRALLVAALGVVATLPEGTIPAGASLALIYAVVFVSTAVSQFFVPARFTILGDIVSGDSERARAAGLLQSIGYTAAVVGPPLAAPLLFQTGPYWALYINAASFVVSFLLVRTIKVAPATVPAEAAPRPGFFGEFRSGLAFATGKAPVRALMIAVTTVTLGVGALNALMVFFVTDNLHSKPDLFGTMGMGEGIGAIAGTLVAGWICARLGDVRVFCYGLAVSGIGILAFARLDNLAQAIVVLAVLGIPMGAVNVALSPILLRAVPRELLGRIAGILTPVQYVASMVAALVAGWLASTALRDLHVSVGPVTFTRIDTIFTAGGLIVLLGAVYARVALRNAGPTEPVGEPQPPVPAMVD